MRLRSANAPPTRRQADPTRPDPTRGVNLIPATGASPPLWTACGVRSSFHTGRPDEQTPRREVLACEPDPSSTPPPMHGRGDRALTLLRTFEKRVACRNDPDLRPGPVRQYGPQVARIRCVDGSHSVTIRIIPRARDWRLRTVGRSHDGHAGRSRARSDGRPCKPPGASEPAPYGLVQFDPPPRPLTQVNDNFPLWATAVFGDASPAVRDARE